MQKTGNLRTHLLGCSLLGLAIASIFLFPLLPGGSHKTIQLPIFDKTHKDFLVAYIGYPSCHTTCPVSLNRLKQAYAKPESQALFDVMVINVQLDVDASVNRDYAKAYHSDFLSYSILSSERQLFMQQLGIQTYSTAEQASQHPGNIYIFKRVNRQWLLHRMYPSLPSSEQLVNDIKNITTLSA